ncbi:MAG: hypothetical protein WKF73_16930 [Nocardioidaceae bacterium]
MSRLADGATPSPNIWNSPHIYELENRAFDPDRLVESSMSAIHSWTGARVLDLGCGTASTCHASQPRRRRW